MEPAVEAFTDPVGLGPGHSSDQTTANDDLAGPSSTFIPRQPSPPLPDLGRRPFPPDEASDNDDDDQDQVVATLPIYLSPALYPHLELFQYPLHRQIHSPTWASDRGKTITSRVKEAVGRIEVEIPVDAGPDVWRDERARELGFVADVNAVNGSGDLEGGYGFGGRSDDKKKAKGKKDKEKRDRWGEKMRLRSEAVPGATGYYSGIVHDGALHLHPISKFVQLRTSLGYLDDYEQAQREASARYRRGGDDDEGDERRAKAAGPARQSKLPQDEENDGSGSIKDFRNKMWSMAQREGEDKWVPYEWLEGEDPSVLEKLEKLIVAPENQERLTCTTRGLDYLNKAGI